jgi:acid phosphatase type 7
VKIRIDLAFRALPACGLAIVLSQSLYSQQTGPVAVPAQPESPNSAAASSAPLARTRNYLGPKMAPGPDRAENRPFKVYDTTPVVVHGPFLLESSETTVTIEWITDTPCTAAVRYGENSFTQEAEPEENALVPVGTLHKILLTGLSPGHAYKYQTVSTRVVRVKPYWPEKGLTLESPSYSFTTPDRNKESISFSVITDTHEDVARIDALMKMIDWKSTDFLVHTGDGVNWAVNEEQIFDNWLDPISEALGHTTPLFYSRGNHDLRGPFARSLDQYLTTPEDHRFYFSRDDGPVHLIFVDTAEDKPDETKVYAGLNKQAPYRQKELAWFKQHVHSDSRIGTAPFRVVLMHQPDWGWLDGNNKEWTDVANEGKIDLIIAGHYHRFMHLQPGKAGNDYPVLVLGQDQVARVEATKTNMHITVTQKGGAVVDTFDVKRRAE